MRAEQLNGLIAIGGGIVIAVLAFVPVAAVHYRRHGRFTLADMVALIAVPVYGLALWTYTLLPLPDVADLVCREAQLDPGRFLADLRSVWDGSWRHLLVSQVFLQLVLNVAFFVPLGVILRLRYRQGVLWALCSGFVISLLIETTQLTGVWGLYECAYRLFDVNDLMTNAAGAVVGSLLAIPVARRVHVDGSPPPTSPTFGRRFVAIVSDGLVLLFGASAVGLSWAVWQTEIRGIPLAEMDTTRQSVLQWGSVFVLEAIVVLGWGRTVGELVVGLRTVATQRWWTFPARTVKLISGVGVVCALAAWSSPWSLSALALLFVVTVVAALVTPEHRGLANWVAGLRVGVVTTGHEQPPDGGLDEAETSPGEVDDSASTGRGGGGDDTVNG